MVATIFPLVFKGFGGRVGGGYDNRAPPIPLLKLSLVLSFGGFTNGCPHNGLCIGTKAMTHGEAIIVDGRI